MIFGISPQALMSQLLVGLINGSFYAMLSLGLAIIFGLLNIVNFAHGALYTLGAFVAWFLLEYAGIGYWGALLLSPLPIPPPGERGAALPSTRSPHTRAQTRRRKHQSHKGRRERKYN